jgi:8-oxo-dGTP pyrophosphatase MutT (NUDIX family)
MIRDILFHDDDQIFSYRIAGICIHNGKVLLQKSGNDPSFAFPGGHVAFGETTEQTLLREFKEEINADIAVDELKWVAEIFFPWGHKTCHQICLFYLVHWVDAAQMPNENQFAAHEEPNGSTSAIEFHWVPLADIHTITLDPPTTAQLLGKLDAGMQHFVYRE